MLKSVLYYSITLLLFSVNGMALDKFVTKRDSSKKTDEYRKVVTYPLLFKNSVPAYSKINEQLYKILERNGCSYFDTATEVNPYIYDVFARIIGLNKSYVGIEVRVKIDCDEPHHPVQGYYHLTFDSKTGEKIEIDDNVSLQTFNPEEPNSIMIYHKALSSLIYDEMKRTGTLSQSCYEGIPREEAIRYIEFDYPEISGLSRFKRVVIKTNPTLENQECREILRVTYDKVKHFINSDSIFHEWLRL